VAKEPEVSVTGRLLSILGSFEASARPLTIAQIAEKTGLPVSTTYRMVVTWSSGVRWRATPTAASRWV